MFVGVQVDIEGEWWMVRVVDKCYYCIYERDNLLDVIAFSRNERTHPNLVSQAREIEIFWTANWPPL